MASNIRPPASPPRSLPIAPTEEEWRALGPAERERLLVEVLDALSERRRLMSEGRLTGLVEELEAKAKQAAKRTEQAAKRTEQAAKKTDQAVAGLHEAVLAVLDARGIACPDDAQARLRSCDDPTTLQRWLSRAKTARAAVEIFLEADSSRSS